MQIYQYDGLITEVTTLDNLVNNYDVIICPNFNDSMSLCLDYQNSRKSIIQNMFPEITDVFFNHLIIFGKKKTSEILTSLNPEYQALFVSCNLNPLAYSNYIKELSLPVSTMGYNYFHDFYFHILGSGYIPISFTKWWKTAQFNDEANFILMAAVVEWTSLKGLSPIIEDIFTQGKWGQLELFFNNYPQINRKIINKVYDSHPQILSFINEWHKIYR